jgi:hypothetical protein
MDGSRFDDLARLLTSRPTRRRTLGLLGLLLATRPGQRAAARELGTATCRERGANCDRRDQCCEAASGHRIGCAAVSVLCVGEPALRGPRCCGQGGARCTDFCACCAGYRCRGGRCRPFEQCEANTCCDCFRCNESPEPPEPGQPVPPVPPHPEPGCETLFCATGLSRRQCARRCRRQGGRLGFVDGTDPFGSGLAVRFECRRGGCASTCPFPWW